MVARLIFANFDQAKSVGLVRVVLEKVCAIVDLTDETCQVVLDSGIQYELAYSGKDLVSRMCAIMLEVSQQTEAGASRILTQ